MHKSLAQGPNRLLIGCWLVGIGVLAATSRQIILLPCVVGVAIGAVAGFLQNRALRRDAQAFAATTSALDVRRVMRLSRAGMGSLAGSWLAGGVLAIVALAGGSDPSYAMAQWFAGYLAFM